MNTTAQGNIFERRVYDALCVELQNERLGLSPSSARIARKKSYYSQDRNANIIVDVSIEVFLADREEPSLVWVFECKDYRSEIPVDDIEEFHAKLQQIGADNTKGTFVTSGGLQKSALNYARSKRIGVIRLLPEDQIVHVIEFSPLASLIVPARINWSEFEAGLTVPTHKSRRNFFAFHDDEWFPSWESLITHELSRYHLKQ